VPAIGNLEAVLFDMDGLLVDTEPQWFEVETEVMARLGGDWTPADQVAVLGSSSYRCATYMLEKVGRRALGDSRESARWAVDVTGESLLVSAQDVVAWLDAGIVEHVRRRVTVLPGARELLDDLSRAAVPCGLVSASVRPMVDAVLSHVGPEHFAVTVSGDDVSHTKPDPEPYLKAIASLGAEPGRCVVLEDSPNGVAAGLAAGCHVVAVPHAATIEPGERLTVVESLTDVDAAKLTALVGSRPAAGPNSTRAHL
jgi:HAD superfamily hydrolase (TIGR01509 family)